MMKVFNYNYRFLLLMAIWFGILYSLVFIDMYMKLDGVLLDMGLLLFVILWFVSIVFNVEKKIFKLLKKSIFSKQLIALAVIGYLASVAFTYHQTNQKINDLDNFSDVKIDFKNVKFISKFQNALFIKDIIIVNIEDKLNIKDVKQYIFQKYSSRDDLAFSFEVVEDKNSYIVYTSHFFDIKISVILLYMLFAILIWSLDWTYQSSTTKWGRIKELIGILFINFFVLGIALSMTSHHKWAINGKPQESFLLNKSYFYDEFFIQSLENNQYKIILKGK